MDPHQVEEAADNCAVAQAVVAHHQYLAKLIRQQDNKHPLERQFQLKYILLPQKTLQQKLAKQSISKGYNRFFSFVLYFKYIFSLILI